MQSIVTILLASATFFFSADSLFAYQIIAEDENCYVFQNGIIKGDTNRYQVIYEVDELNKTITAIKETDLRNGGEYAQQNIFQIVDQPTVDLSGVPQALRGFRINPKRGNIETISFCNGEYNFSKTTEEYINLFYGKYKVVKQ